MEIWCYMVFLPFYWDIGFSGKLKSKICDGISLAIYGVIRYIYGIIRYIRVKGDLMQFVSKIFIGCN